MAEENPGLTYTDIMRVYKFHMPHQLILLAYTYDEQSDEAVLLYFAPHENFYETLKKKVN